jgi:hypothetical protein
MTDDDIDPPADNDSYGKVIIMKQVAAYRDLLRSISKSANGTLTWGVIMMALWLFIYARNGMPNWATLKIPAYIHLGIALIELGTGLWKKIAPSPWAILFDAGLMLGFAGMNGYYAYERYLRNGKIDTISIVFAVLMLVQAFQQFRSWRMIRRSLIVEPNREQLRWFDDLVREVKQADPESDETALLLKSRPVWKAKLLGNLGFFVSDREEVVVAHPAEVDLPLDGEGPDENGSHIALLDLPSGVYGPFKIDATNLKNFRAWNG